MGEDQDPSPVRRSTAQLIPGHASVPDGEKGSADAENAGGALDASHRSLEGQQAHGSAADSSAPRENDTSAPGQDETGREISVEEWRRHRAHDLDRGGQTKTSDEDARTDQRPDTGVEKTHELCETGQECSRKEAPPHLDPMPGA